jgi:hypothetical protein
MRYWQLALGALAFGSTALGVASCSGGNAMTLPEQDTGVIPVKDGTTLDSLVVDGFMWPDCNTMPTSAKVSTLPQIWADNPSKPIETWVSGVYVTAVSKGACQAGTACSFFVQQDLSYPSLNAAAKHALKVFVSAATAVYFAGIAVGDKVDLLGHAWRYNLDNQNELLLQVNQQLPGCFKKTGSGTATAVTAQLTDFNVNAYENTLGPVLVDVFGVSGTPQNPDETFGLFKTGQFNDAGIASVTSLSPFFLAGGVFTTLTKGMKTNFTRVTGVFGVFIPAQSMTKYLEIYPRTSADIQL